MIPAFPVYLFDVDGTLLDSADDICGAVLDVLKKTPCPPLGKADLTKYIGVHLLGMFRELLPEYTPEQYEELIAEYRTLYPLREHRSTRVYPGVKEALEALGGRKSTATTKGTSTTRAGDGRVSVQAGAGRDSGLDGGAGCESGGVSAGGRFAGGHGGGAEGRGANVRRQVRVR